MTGIAIGVYVILLVVVAFVSFQVAPPSEGMEPWKEFARIAGVGIAAVSGLMAAVTSLITMSKQNKAKQDFEKLKNYLPNQSKGYQQLYAAASNYYRVLAKLEKGTWDAGGVEGAEKKMAESEGLSVFIDPEHNSLWMKFWGAARAIGEDAQQNPTQIQREEIWKREVTSFGKLLAEFREISKSRLSPPI